MVSSSIPPPPHLAEEGERTAWEAPDSQQRPTHYAHPDVAIEYIPTRRKENSKLLSCFASRYQAPVTNSSTTLCLKYEHIFRTGICGMRGNTWSEVEFNSTQKKVMYHDSKPRIPEIKEKLILQQKQKR